MRVQKKWCNLLGPWYHLDAGADNVLWDSSVNLASNLNALRGCVFVWNERIGNTSLRLQRQAVLVSNDFFVVY